MNRPAWMGGALTGAEFSADRRFRYVLWRIWEPTKALLGVVMLNPSTADADANDPTIKVVVRRAQRAGYGGVVVGNLYAYTATDPADMARARAAGEDVVGPGNDASLARLAEAVDRAWCAWGAHAEPARVDAVRAILRPMPLVAVGFTRGGRPRHPLRVALDTPFASLPA